MCGILSSSSLRPLPAPNGLGQTVWERGAMRMGRAVDHTQRREIFAAAALRVIMRDGIAGLTVRAVAKEAGFTTGALTHYFHSKDQLLIEASEHSATLVRDRMERAEKTRPTLEEFFIAQIADIIYYSSLSPPYRAPLFCPCAHPEWS